MYFLTHLYAAMQRMASPNWLSWFGSSPTVAREFTMSVYLQPSNKINEQTKLKVFHSVYAPPSTCCTVSLRKYGRQIHGLNTCIDIKVFVCFSLKLNMEVFSCNSLPVSRPYFVCYFLREDHNVDSDYGDLVRYL
jgi:hypothetical protein